MLYTRKESLYMPAQPGVFLERFQSGNGYAKGSAGTLAQDTVDFVVGNQSMKLTSGTDNVVMQATKTYGAPFDLSGSYLHIKAKISNWANLQEFSVYLANEAGFTNWVSLDVGSANDGQSYHFFDDGVWTHILLDLGETLPGGGTFNPALVTTLRIRVGGQNNQAAIVWINEISAVRKLSKGVVCITADDGWATQDTSMRKALDKYGFRPTIYIIPDTLEHTGYMKLTDVKRLQNVNRWETGLHHQTGMVDMRTTNNLGYVESELQRVIKFGVYNGFNGTDHFAMPSGQFDADILLLMQQYFKTSAAIIYGRSSTAPYLEQAPFPNPYKLRRFDVRNNHAVATINALMDRVAAQKSVGIFNWHKFVSSPSGVITEYLDTDFQLIIDHLATLNVDVMPVGELYSRMRGSNFV